jgi:hypothetical protein
MVVPNENAAERPSRDARQQKNALANGLGETLAFRLAYVDTA